MTTFCNTLLDLIKEKSTSQVILKDLEWRLLQHRSVDTSESSPKDSNEDMLAELKQEIEQKQAQIENLDGRISEFSEKSLWAPLCLLPMPHSHRPLLQRLERALSMLEELESDGFQFKADLIDAASNEVERALELLKLDMGARLSDRALTWLFWASILEKQEDFGKAQKWAQKAYEYFSDGDEPQRLVTRLIQGNIYSANVAQKKFEGRHAYGDAIWRFERLSETEAGQGNQQRAELYRLLKERLEEEVERVRTWRTV